ncbi:MAG: LysR family hydrogen peroxide-inducible transcriptional activator [Oleiphilaceae bacterium]|jgi:LysR family hydrogen peroxide-inducible transcriptional activator
MTLTELRYIVTLSQERHFGRAAEKCFVSQPTLSVAVKKLEDELGVALFERSKGSIVVTELGQRLVEQAKNILDQANIFKDMALLGKDELNSPLKLGAIYTIGPYLFPHLMPKIRSAAPDMPLYIEENYTAVLRKKLKQCELDAIIVALPFNEPDVVTLPLYDEPFVVLLPKDHALSKHQTISSDMLLTDNLLMLGPGHCFRDQVLAACPNILNSIGLSGLERESKQKLITEGSSLETIRHMVASGLGISILPQSAAMKGYYDESLLDVRPFEAPVPYRSVALAWRVTFPRPKAIDLLAMATKKCKVLTADD